jgi:hypothetical protein
MKRLAYLTVASPVTLKGVFTKPLKFVIQIFTAAPEEHIAHCIDGVVCNVSGEGLEYIPFIGWMERYGVNRARIHAIEPIEEPTQEQIDAIMKVNKEDEGKPYGAIRAGLSANVMEFIYGLLNLSSKNKDKTIFCSGNCAKGNVAAGYLSSDFKWWRASPVDLRKALLKTGKFTRRRIN